MTDQSPERRVTGEHPPIEPNGVARWWQSWGKIVGAIVGTFAVVQGLNTMGPCTTGWKFQTIEAASTAHAATNEKIASTNSRIDGIDKRLVDLDKKIDRVYYALPKKWRKQ